MQITFDPAKNRRNEDERGLPFSLAADFDWSQALIAEDTRQAYPEKRYQALGLIEEHLYMLVFTPREGDLHVISLRRANRRERIRYMPHKPNPERLDDDAPELGAEWFAKARPATQVLEGMFGKSAAKEMLQPKRGRPALAQTKEHVNIRLDADVLGAFKETGAGWQTRMNNALRDWLKNHPKQVA